VHKEGILKLLMYIRTAIIISLKISSAIFYNRVDGLLIDKILRRSLVAAPTLFGDDLQALAAKIPEELSSTDSPVLLLQDESASTASPIISLDGQAGTNLGVLLWTFVLYQTLLQFFLPLIVKIFGKEDKEWFLNFKTGYKYIIPVSVELPSIIFFVMLGYFVNFLTIKSFDGDTYWGWAISGSLAIPVSLLSLARNSSYRLTKEQDQQQKQLKMDFNEFAGERLREVSGSKCKEELIILAFRRFLSSSTSSQSKNPSVYMDENIFPDKVIRRIVRKYIGYSCDSDGYYRNVELLRNRASRLFLADNVNRKEVVEKEYSKASAETLVESNEVFEKPATTINSEAAPDGVKDFAR